MKQNNILALSTPVGFLLFHLLVDSHYKPNADDFAGMYYASKGLPGIGYATRFYMEFEGPFLSMLVQGLWMRLLSMGVPGVFILGSIKLMFLLSATYAYNGLFSYLNKKGEWHSSLLCGAVTVTVLYTISSAQDEVWHWVMGSIVYVHPQIAVFLLVGLLLRKRFALSTLPLLYLMQSRATYAVMFLGLYSMITIYFWVAKHSWRKQVTVGNIILLAGFCVYLFAPGNTTRMTTADFDIAHYLHEYKREIRNVFISFNLAKIDRVLIAVVAIVPFLPKTEAIRNKLNTARVLLPAAAYVGFVLIHAVIFVGATGYGAWNRVVSMHSLLFFIVCLYYSYLFYNSVVRQEKHAWLSHYGAPFCVLLLGLKLYSPIFKQLEVGSRFASAYEERSAVVFSFQGSNKDTLFVTPLPSAGLLHYRELSKDAGYWINDDYRMRYDLRFQIALKPNESSLE